MGSDRDSDESGWHAFPGVDDAAEGRPGPVLFAMDVDGEHFAVRRSPDGGCTYDWLSGPNEGYGFSISGPPIQSEDQHRKHIRGFLSMIDPATGYIGND